MKNKCVIRTVGIAVALLLAIPAPVFAEPAPVFDADSMPPFDQGVEEPNPNQAGDDLPMGGPENSEEQMESGFVPMQPEPRGQENSTSFESPGSNRPISGTGNQLGPTSSETTKQRLRRIEQQMANMQSSEKTAKLESLQNQVQTLRAEIDQLNNQLHQLQPQQKVQADQTKETDTTTSPAANPADTHIAPVANQDSPSSLPVTENKAKKITKTITQQETTAKSPSENTANIANHVNAVNTEQKQPNVAEEQQTYLTAYNLIKAKKYNDAIQSLRSMLNKYPRGQFASNAHYWLGELYGLSGKNNQALIEYSTVVQEYPDSSRVAEALLKVGMIFAGQSNWIKAKASLKRIVNHYPGTAAASSAAEQLKLISLAGH